MAKTPKPAQIDESDEDGTPTTSRKAAEHEDPNHPSRWVHRRRMAYTALISMVVVTAYVFTPAVSIEKLKAVGPILDTFYFATASIVGVYMGAATFSGVWNKSSK